jgi:predicted PolB exonuclease-like 3'-5' exonuclease
MFHDEIVEEIHRIREQYSRSFNHDLKAIFADLQKQQAESGREVVSLSRKQVWAIGDPNTPPKGTLDPDILLWCERYDF